MESRVAGAPLVVWVFLIFLGLIIGLPMWLEYNSEIHEIKKVDTHIVQLMATPPPTGTPTVVPTASPSATPTTFFVPFKRVVPTSGK